MLDFNRPLIGWKAIHDGTSPTKYVRRSVHGGGRYHVEGKGLVDQEGECSPLDGRDWDVREELGSRVRESRQRGAGIGTFIVVNTELVLLDC